MAIDFEQFPNLAPDIQNGRTLPRRSAYVTLAWLNNGGKLEKTIPFNGLNTKFTIEENLGDHYPVANVSVCNPKPENRALLTNYLRFSDANYINREINIFAGYLKPGQSEKDTPFLFDGNIVFTRFTEPPDVWVEMEIIHRCMASALRPQNWTIQGTQSAATILRKAAEELKLELVLKDTPDVTVTNFTSAEDGKALLRQLRKTFPGYSIHVRGNQLIVMKSDTRSPAPGETIWEIREDTGMIGIPIVEWYGVECTLLLNPALHAGDWIDLKSKYQPGADGIYQIKKVTHEGELRGKDFYTKIEAWNTVDRRAKK